MVIIKKEKNSKIMENKRKSNSQMVEEIKECRDKVQISKDNQKVQSVEDYIKSGKTYKRGSAWCCDVKNIENLSCAISPVDNV